MEEGCSAIHPVHPVHPVLRLICVHLRNLRMNYPLPICVHPCASVVPSSCLRALRVLRGESPLRGGVARQVSREESCRLPSASRSVKRQGSWVRWKRACGLSRPYRACVVGGAIPRASRRAFGSPLALGYLMTAFQASRAPKLGARPGVEEPTGFLAS